jgi:urease accessory protein
MGWHARLRLDYRRDAAGRCLGHALHDGPLRVLKALYPEGPGICHHVLVHPPAGLVGGDRLDVTLDLGAGSHALLTTPGATRWYRSLGPEAAQTVQVQVGAGARLEWLPLENLVYPGANARSALRVALADDAAMLGWEITALGLPAADAPFTSGRLQQRLEIAGRWLDQATIDAADARLLDSPLGLAGRRVMGTLWLAWGTTPARAAADAALECARDVLADAGVGTGAGGEVLAGVSAVQPGVIVVRALAQRTEPLMQRLRAVRRAWRRQVWALDGDEPRVWAT